MKTLLKLAAIFAVLAGNVGSTASAHGQQEMFIIFWDSEEHNYQVGGNVIYCDGHFTHFGSYSLYMEEFYFGCD